MLSTIASSHWLQTQTLVRGNKQKKSYVVPRGCADDCIHVKSTLHARFIQPPEPFFSGRKGKLLRRRNFTLPFAQSAREPSLFSHVRLCATPWTIPTRLLCPWDSPGKNTGVGALFQGNFPDPGVEPTSLRSPEVAGGFFASVHPESTEKFSEWDS